MTGETWPFPPTAGESDTMKIADSDSIKAGERELISSIMEKLNPETLSRVATKHLSPDQMEFVQGDMMIQDNRIVYKMDFKVTLDISVMFDRDGDLVITDQAESDSAIEDSDITDNPDTEWETEELPEPLPQESQPSNDSQTLSMDEEMALVFSKTREFWNLKSEEALESLDESSELSE